MSNEKEAALEAVKNDAIMQQLMEDLAPVFAANDDENHAMVEALKKFDSTFKGSRVNLDEYATKLMKADKVTRKAAAECSLQPVVLDALANDLDANVRTRVAGNKMTSERALRHLLNDSDNRVSFFAELGLEDIEMAQAAA